MDHPIQWGSKILLRCARINLHGLADTMVSMGCAPDAELKPNSRRKWTPLARSCYEGQLEMIKILLKDGANAEFLDSKNQRPLQIAVSMGHINVLRSLFTHHEAVELSKDPEESND